MKLPVHALQTRRVNLLIGAAMATAWAMFAVNHVLAFQRSGQALYLLFFASETLAALMFLIRTEPVSVSAAPADWALAIGATFAPFLFQPAPSAILVQGALLVVAGTAAQVAGLISLNRSIGMVAAQRQIKTAGMYRVVRHPLYASYLLTFTGYVLSNTSAANLALYAATLTLLLLRLLREERHLAQDQQYRDYMHSVPYRVIPLVF